MSLKRQPTPEELRITRADILMSTGAENAIRALGIVAEQHWRRAVKDADSELSDYWQRVLILLDATHQALKGMK